MKGAAGEFGLGLGRQVEIKLFNTDDFEAREPDHRGQRHHADDEEGRRHGGGVQGVAALDLHGHLKQDRGQADADGLEQLLGHGQGG